MTKQEYEYYITVVKLDYNAAQYINLRVQYMNAKFGKSFSIDDLIDAERIFQKSDKQCK